MSTPADESIESRVAGYAREFIQGYTDTIDAHFQNAKNVILGAGPVDKYLPLYGRKLGEDLAIAVFFTQIDFYLFFFDRSDAEIEAIRNEVADNTREFGRQWVSDTPGKRRIQRVREYLGLEEEKVLRPTPYSEAINIYDINFGAWDALNMRVKGHEDGVIAGQQVGELAESRLPRVRENLRQETMKSEFSNRYRQLLESSMRPQDRGNAFEELWRQVLEFYGWKPKKYRISGEENDFTALYQGLHILGEVRWFSRPMNGAKMREFLAKLDPRPQTIGLFVSHSDVNKGGMDVVRRSVNTKTVVVFGKAVIEKVLLEGADPGLIFEEKLRDAYDYISENS